MKSHRIFFIILFFSLLKIHAQTVPVTLHYKPIIDDFTILRLVGNFNGWNNNDPTMVMTDDDGDGVFEITKEFAIGVEHMYKFVFDANWSFAWNDPDNPNIKTSDNNNSVLNVTDPFITYLLPRGVNTAGVMYTDTTKNGEPIRAIFAFTNANPIDLNSLIVTIDGEELSNPQQYYDELKKEFYYQPTVPLSAGEHTIEVSITSNAGTVTKSSTFNRIPGLTIYKAPVDFYYDLYNTGTSIIQNINSVSLVGDFNNWNELFDPMNDDNDDGLWEVTTLLEKGNYEYKFKLNGSLWINDPDEPNFSASSDNNVFAVTVDSIPSLKLVSPNEGSIFSNQNNEITLSVLLRPGVTSTGVNEASIAVKVNEAVVSSEFDPETNLLTSVLTLNLAGNNIVDISFENDEGLVVTEKFTYGIYNGVTGDYYADSENDEQYAYPQNVEAGSADILSVLIDEVPTHDSLSFTINIKDITDRTRLGLIITNPVPTVTEDILGLDITTEDWQNEGVFTSIAAPSSTYLDSKENKFWIASEVAGDELNVKSDAIESDEFNFKISLAYLDSLLGSWTRERNIYVFSYLASEEKNGTAFEVTSNEGGSDDIEDPDIYDAAYFRSAFWQERVLDNFIPAGGRMGPRMVSLDGLKRGKKSFTAESISDSLATYGPAITFLTPSTEIWYNELNIVGTLSDLNITSIIFSFNGEESTKSASDGEFSIPVTLVEGKNIIFVKATDNQGFESTSKNLEIEYKPNYNPDVFISSSVENRSVTLTAAGESPKELSFTYFWTRDENNPVDISLIGQSTNESIAIDIPNVEGEYFFNVRARDSEGRFAYARAMIISKSDTVYVAGLNDIAAWIDDAVFYEIYPRSYTQEGTFKGIENKIPEMLNLGINAVWLMPIYTGPTTHGYEITDYLGFEEDFGTKEDFKDLVAAFHDAGIRVILDFVVNHTSIQHPFMQNVLEYREHSPWADFYIWEGEPGNSNYEFFFDWASLPNLNHNNKDVREYFIDVAKYWIKEYDIDGYRCDVAWGVEERNTSFWQEWRLALKNLKPEVFLQAEASSSQPVYYQNRFDSANDWDLRNKLLGVSNGTLAINVLDDELRKDYPENAKPFRFVENHDEVRVASSYDAQRSKLMHTILLTANGIPLIYSGGEVGELTNRGLIDWTDRDNMRPYFQQIIKIRKHFLTNPELDRITTSLGSDIYAYSSKSGEHNLITVVNFRNESKQFTIDLTSHLDGETIYYLSNLMDSTYSEVSSNYDAVELQLNAYEAKIFYFGTEPTLVDVGDNLELIIDEFKLNQNYPNPFNPVTNITFHVPETEFVSLKIYDVIGREVDTIVNKSLTKGKYAMNFNASNLSSGIYFYRMKAGKFMQTKKMILMK